MGGQFETAGLGQDLLKGSNNLIQFAGGADSITGALENATPAIGKTAAALLLLQGNLIASRNGAAALAKGFGALGLAAAAAAVGDVAGNFIEKKRTEATLAPLKQLEAANAEGLKNFKSQLADAKDAGDKADQDRLKSALEFTQKLNQVYLKQQADLEAANKAIKKLKGSDSAQLSRSRQLADAQKQVDTLTSIPRNQRLTESQHLQLSKAQAQVDLLINQQTKLLQAQNKLRQLTSQTQHPLVGVQGIDQLTAITGQTIGNPDQLSRALISSGKTGRSVARQTHGGVVDRPAGRQPPSRIE